MTFHTKDLSKLKFLVTGGAGFIGSHIVDYLVENNAGLVRVVDNLSTGSLQNIQQHRNNPNFEFIEADLTEYVVSNNASKGIDIIFHEAALGSVPRSIEQPLNTNNHNVNAQLNVLWAAVQNNVKRFVYASSSSVYGDDSRIPKVEEFTGTPLSPYAVSKKVNELYAGVFASLYDLHVIGLRYFNVFGPRQNPKGPYAAVIPLFIDALMSGQVPVIYGSGNQSRDFTYVDNIVQANIQAAFCDKREVFGQIMNIGAGGNTSVNDLFAMIAGELGSDISPVYQPARKGDVQRSSASVDKAARLIGYAPHVKIEEGIKRTIKGFQDIEV